MSLWKLQKKMAVITVLFSITALVFMLHHAWSKQFSVAEVAYAKEREASGTAFDLQRREADAESSSYDLRIPVPEGLHYEDLRMENHYFTKKLVVRLRTGREDFYRKHPISCDFSKVKEAVCEKGEKDLTLSFTLNKVYDFDVDLTGGMISLHFLPVAGRYTHLVLLDPSAEPGENAQVSLLIARKMVKLSRQEGDSIRFFISRTGEDAPTDSEVERFISETGADRYLRLSARKELPAQTSNVQEQETQTADVREQGAQTSDVQEQETQTADVREKGAQTADVQEQGAQTSDIREQGAQEDAACMIKARTLYSDGYYIRNFGNVAFANTMEEALYHGGGFEPLGLMADPDPSSLLHHLRILGAQVELGADCLEQETGEEDKKQEDILNQAAAALYEGLVQSYEQAEH